MSRPNPAKSLMGKSLRVGALLTLVVGLTSSGPALAGSVQLNGRWWTPLGVMRVVQKGKRVVGKVNWKCKVCPFKRGEEIFKGVLLEDSLSGRMRYCLKGKECKGDGWAPLVMLVAREGRVLSGAAHFKASDCAIGGKGSKDGIVMRKLRKRKPKPKTVVDAGTPAQADGGKTVAVVQPKPGDGDQTVVEEQGENLEPEVQALDPNAYVGNAKNWQDAMVKGAGQMEAGFFERARRLFNQATKLDPTRPEAFNGIGVTYYARHDYEEALRWYKKALEVDANFGDAYYNMACIYALQRKKDLSFRYLHIAALNGFVQPQVLEQDTDLNNRRDDKRYKKIRDQMLKKGQ